MMKYSEQVFIQQYPIVASFIRHLAYYKANKSVYDQLSMVSPFWTATIDAHIMIAVINWCKVFGSYGPNQTHWTKTPIVDKHKLQDSFRTQILAAIGYTQQQWDDYHKSMCRFRDKYVVHTEIDFSEPVPNFTVALNIAYEYEIWVRDMLVPDFLDDQPLKIYFEQWTLEATAIAEAAMSASKGKAEFWGQHT